MKKGSKFYSITRCKCPRCQEADLFVNKASYNITKMMEMHGHCTECGLDFMPEAGYYYGAMYVSYAFAAIEIALITSLIYFANAQAPTWVYLLAFTAIMLLAAPLNFRLGRAGWINIFYRYDAHALEHE